MNQNQKKTSYEKPEITFIQLETEEIMNSPSGPGGFFGNEDVFNRNVFRSRTIDLF